ncbi:MAG: TlpA disulfide reductase family protein [Saprospiraceae bacterium]|nr:TlpA family protein disulfide reductase [Saprospiraceae bacterium]MDW8229378.1 TlpA disulfide reductase family protein [Saprospiraceae bacterium]
MRKTLLLLLVTTFTFSLMKGQDTIPFIKSAQLSAWRSGASDTVYVLNFWATWCAPCVAELPHFEKLHAEYSQKPVRVVLVSTDFRRDVDRRLKPFVERHALKSHVVFLDEKTPNDWIDVVATEWSGAIPATLVVQPKKKFERFFERQVHYEDLEKAVQEALGQ